MSDEVGRPEATSGRIPPAAYGVLLVVYVGLGLLTKSVVLNWIIGPLFPLLVLYVAPRLVRGRSGPGREPSGGAAREPAA